MHFTIPKELEHLRVDERGYPIPFFVGYHDGKPNFRYGDTFKRDICLAQKKCAICGKKLPRDFSYVITGPEGYANQIVSDAPMHRRCAEFTMDACPHIHFEKAQRKEDVTGTDLMAKKPDVLLLIKIDKYKLVKDRGNVYINFRPVAKEEYIYENNVLVKRIPR